MSIKEPSHESLDDLMLLSGSGHIHMSSLGGGILSFKLPNNQNQDLNSIFIKGGTFNHEDKLGITSIHELNSTPLYSLLYNPNTQDPKEITYSIEPYNNLNLITDSISHADNSLNLLHNVISALDVSLNTFSILVNNNMDSLSNTISIQDTSINTIITEIETEDNHINTIMDSSLNINDISINTYDLCINIIDSSLNIYNQTIGLQDNSLNIFDNRITQIDISLGIIDNSLNILDTSLNILDIPLHESFGYYGESFSIGEDSSYTGSSYSFAIGKGSSVGGTNSVSIGSNVFATENNSVVIGNTNNKIGIGNNYPIYELDVSGEVITNNVITNSGMLTSKSSSKIVLQNAEGGGSGQGIYLWTNDDTNWGIYMAQSGAGRALDDGTAPAGSYFTGHSVRFRCHDGVSNGFIFENSANERALEIRSDGYVYTPYSYITNWFRSDGQSGWYNDTYLGGIYMADSNYVRTYGNKGFLATNIIRIHNFSTTTDYWEIGNEGGPNLRFSYNGTYRGYVSPSSSSRMNFTGQHRTFVENINYYHASHNQGLIVCADNNMYIDMSYGANKGNVAITQNESLPVVSLSTKQMDKSCFGVISYAENSENRIYAYGSFETPYRKENGDTRIVLNSIGEGAVWVSNKNGSLESGDYITTSDIPGYGEKQDSVFLANYTVAKITMDCDFNPQSQPKEIILKQETLDASGNTIYENVLDDNGMLQWTNELDGSGNIVYEYPYNLRYLDLSGNRYSKDDYESKIANNEEVYIAAYVGCTYHCG
jgi:hypothetical protein